MLTIRNKQLKIFGKIKRNKFEERVFKYFQKMFPQKIEEIGSDEMRELICDGIDRAFSYKIRRERAVVSFIKLMFAIDPHFEKLPEFDWIKTVLEKRNESDLMRMHLISAYLEDNDSK